MCGWCNFELEPTYTEYEMDEYDIHIGLAYESIVVSRHPHKLCGGADEVLEFPIKFCPMCGRNLKENKTWKSMITDEP